MGGAVGIERIKLTDGFVLLRPIEAEDYEDYLEASKESFYELSEWMWASPDMPLEEVRRSYLSGIDEWEQGSGYVFSILAAGDQNYLGECFLSPIDSRHRMANLGYWVRTGQTKRGVATAAVRLLAAFGVRELGLLRIELGIATGNLRSQRVAEKSGAVREGVLRNKLVWGDRVLDAVMYSIIPSDVFQHS
jgi:ribosomal-protein-serine acetyltransferase